MTKLEWCRANAPDSFKGLSNDELLQAMEPMIHSGFVDVPDFDTEEADVSDAYSVLMSKMDKIVLMLVREYGNKLAFTVERMLSGKVTAILSRKRFRRPKYIYDVYCLTNVFDYDSTLVTDFILKRTEGAGAEWRNYPFTEVVLREYEKAYNSLNVRAVTKTYFDKPEFDKVMQRFDLICSKLLYPDLRPIWDHTKEVFVECRQ